MSITTFSNQYTPITGATGTQALVVTNASQATLTIPAGCNAALISALGDNILLKMSGENIASGQGIVLPLHEAMLLTNAAQMAGLKVQGQTGNATLFVQYFGGAV